MFTLSNFYKSKEWESFRRVVIESKMTADGFLYCDHCGKPIVKKYDIIVHHKDELTEANVNDYNISLNPRNMAVVHFRCHNEIHKRFGFGSGGYKPQPKKVYLVHGAPCAGKTTWVHENATENDIIVDMDSIWQMISNNERYVKPDRLKGTVFDVRDSLYDIIKYRKGKWQNAFVISASPRIGDRERLKARIGADELIHIDTDKDTCIERSIGKGADWRNYITDYFDSLQI